MPYPASPYLASLSHCSFPPFLFPHYFLTGRGLPIPYPSPLLLPHPTRPCPDPIGPRIPDGATRFLSENVANYVALFSAKCAQLCCTFRGQLPYPAAHQGATPWVQSGVGGTAKRKQFIILSSLKVERSCIWYLCLPVVPTPFYGTYTYLWYIHLSTNSSPERIVWQS